MVSWHAGGSKHGKGHHDGADERKGRDVLRGMAAAVRALLGLFSGAGRRKADDGQALAAGDATLPEIAAAPPAATRETTETTDTAGAEKIVTPEERTAMSSGFDMHAEIADLARRIIEPVAGNLTAERLELVVAATSEAFERLDAGGAAPEPDFGLLAAAIVEPARANLTDSEYRRAVDRLGGAMAAFCQGLGQQRAA